MKIEELPVGTTHYTQLGSRVLAVLVRRVDGWCVYVDAVPGYRHSNEWQRVEERGSKQSEGVARAIVTELFYPGFDPGDLPYAL